MNLNKYLIGLVATVATSSVFASPLLNEGFNDISTLGASGWVMTNNSTGAVGGVNSVNGGTNWFQGDTGFFNAAQGQVSSYIGANAQNTIFGGAISNWLITPELALANGEKLNFSLRLLGEGALDKVEVYYSAAGASVDVGNTTTSTGAFTLLDSFSASADTGWTTKSLTLSGLSGNTTGRFAFRYVGSYDNSDYIGIDTVSVTTAVPEPTTALMLLLGLGVVAVSRKKLRLLALAGLSASTLVAQAAEPTTGPNGLMVFPHAHVAVQPELIATPAPAGSGMVAYKDAATGQLVGPSAEQAADLAAAAVPLSSAKLSAASARVKAGGFAAPLTTSRGGVGVTLDESTASFAVVHKGADGKLIESCVPGEDVANHLAHGPSLPVAQGEKQ